MPTALESSYVVLKDDIFRETGNFIFPTDYKLSEKKNKSANFFSHTDRCIVGARLAVFSLPV